MPQLCKPRLLRDQTSFSGHLYFEPLYHCRRGNHGANTRGVASADLVVAHRVQNRCHPVPSTDAFSLLRQIGVRHGANLTRFWVMPSAV